MDNSEREAIRDYIERNLAGAKWKQRIALAGVNGLLFLIFNVIAWGIILSARASISEQAFAGTLMLSIGWGVGLFMHVLSVLLEGKAGETQLRKNLVLQARIERAVYGTTADDLYAPAEKDKRKRDQAMALSDDGEMIPVDELQDDTPRSTRTTRQQ
jgi:hypothetical protein